jgi:N-acetylneuraminic acid mutarotase
VAQRALPAGTYRRRALFGLLDADGWGWAALKATFWFFLIIFVLGYLPDRAYYFTVFPTLDVGANVISPVNFCDSSNKNLPCPAPPGAVVPWERNPQELTLPQPRAGASIAQSGMNMYLVGGETKDGPTDSVLATQVTATGNFGKWSEGPKLPAPRSQAAVVTFSGVPYVIGGLNASGAPTDTVYAGTVTEGTLQSWEPKNDLRLPKALSGASAIAATNGMWVLGGRTADKKPSATVYRAKLNATQNPPALGKWEEVAQLPLPEARSDAVGVLVGNFIYVLGGEGPSGITNKILRLRINQTGDPAQGAAGAPEGWALTQAASQELPEPRTEAGGYTSNGAIYVVGGRDATGKIRNTNYWAVPSGTTGVIPEWKRLDQTDLRDPRADPAASVVGSFVFLVGGKNDSGPLDSSLRANLAPKAPFFRLGLFGATVPALSIKGEIGQQLGYINAFGLGLTNFTILVLLAWAFSHPQQSRRFLERVTRGRYRAPPEEDDYFR